MSDLKEELKIYKDRLEEAMAAGNLAWWEMDLPSGKIRFNESKATMLGYSPDRFVHYEDFTELVHPDDYDECMKAMRDHLEGKKESYEVEYRIESKSGAYIWFKDKGGITERHDDGTVKKVTGIVIDITDRKKAEKEQKILKESLSENVKRYRDLLNTINEAIIIHDEEGKLLEVNQSASEMLSYSLNELLKKNIYDIVSPEQSRKIEDRILQAESEDLVFESELVTKQGEKIPVEVSMTRIAFKNKSAFLGVVRDITKRKRFKRREFYYSLLRQDMKNKLSTSTGYLQLIKKEKLSDEDKDYLNKSIEMNKLGSDIVNLAEHIERTDRNRVGKVDLRETLQSTFEKCQDTIDCEGIECEKDIDDVSCRVRAGMDFDLVISTLINTRTLVQDSDKIRISADEGDDEVLLRIEDNGKRISDKTKILLEEGGYTGATSGLGGAVYYALRESVKNYGGRIMFNDSDMGGARFDIYLKKDVSR